MRLLIWRFSRRTFSSSSWTLSIPAWEESSRTPPPNRSPMDPFPSGSLSHWTLPLDSPSSWAGTSTWRSPWLSTLDWSLSPIEVPHIERTSDDRAWDWTRRSRQTSPPMAENCRTPWKTACWDVPCQRRSSPCWARSMSSPSLLPESFLRPVDSDGERSSIVEPPTWQFRTSSDEPPRDVHEVFESQCWWVDTESCEFIEITRLSTLDDEFWDTWWSTCGFLQTSSVITSNGHVERGSLGTMYSGTASIFAFSNDDVESEHPWHRLPLTTSRSRIDGLPIATTGWYPLKTVLWSCVQYASIDLTICSTVFLLQCRSRLSGISKMMMTTGRVCFLQQWQSESIGLSKEAAEHVCSVSVWWFPNLNTIWQGIRRTCTRIFSGNCFSRSFNCWWPMTVCDAPKATTPTVPVEAKHTMALWFSSVNSGLFFTLRCPMLFIDALVWISCGDSTKLGSQSFYQSCTASGMISNELSCCDMLPPGYIES